MRGFLVGSFALIVLYVAVQPGVAGKAAGGGNVLVTLLRHGLSPQVAGIPNHGGPSAQQFGQDALNAVLGTMPPGSGGGGKANVR